MRFFLFLIRESKLNFVLALLAGAVGGLATAGLLAVINDVISGDPAALGERRFWIFVGLMVLVPVARIGSRHILVRFGEGMGFRLRVELSRRILASPLRNLETIGNPRLIAALVNDVGAITNALAMIPLLSVNVTIVVGCLAYLGWLSWPLLLGFLVFIGLGVVGYRLPQLVGLRLFNRVRDEQDTLFKQFEAMTRGNKELKLHRRRRDRFLEAVTETAGTLRGLNVSAATVFAGATSLGELVLFVALGLLLFVAPGRLPGVDREVLTGYTLLLLYMTNPMQFILNSLPQLDRATVSLRRLRQLDLAADQAAAGAEVRPPAWPAPRWGRLTLDGARHSYTRESDERSFTVGPIDLDFEPGATVFVIGGNGSGKTTLLKMLCGLYALEQGELRLDGEPITEERREWYWQHFAVVFSDFFLFDSLLGLEAPRLDDRAGAYLERLQLHHKVQVEEGRLSTTELSQGQRKRLALLTAYLEDRPVYVFDEWAADQDPVFKEVFYRQLLPDLKARGKTVFVISHDDHYYDLADRIIKLTDGQVDLDRMPVAATAG